MKTVYIAEKPDIGRTLAAYLWQNDCKREKGYFQNNSGDTAVTWAYGHILGNANPEEYDEKYKSWSSYPIIPEIWKLKPAAAAKEQLKIIEKLLSDSDIVIHAGDPDREGQLLIDEILEYLHYTGKVQRLLINAKDDTSLKRAFDNIEDNNKYKNLYFAGLGRSRADWLVGMNLSRAYTVNARKYGYENTFRIGRVKIPTLALVVNREKQIKNFKPEKFYELQGIFTKDGITFKAMLKPSDKLADEEGRIKDKTVLEAIKTKIDTADIIVKEVQTKAGISYPPLPYSLDTLQVEANKKYSLSPKTVLDTVQKLYEKKYVSYPRSDCNYIPEAQKEDAAKILAILRTQNLSDSDNADEKITGKAFNDKKITAHHAIIPTIVKPEALEGTEKDIYEMIARRYILQFYAPCKFEKTTFTLSAADEIFTGSGKKIIDPGFTACKSSSSDIAKEDTTLPALDRGDKIPIHEYLVLDKITTPPKRFTEGTLLSAMANIYKFVDSKNPNREKLKEVKGIGTPATRDTIIAELQETNIKGKAVEACIKQVKKELLPTPFGIQLIENIDQSLTRPDTTAEMEYALSEVAAGKKELASFTDDIIAMIYQNIRFAENKQFAMPEGREVFDCPICQKPLIRRFSAKADKHFFVCSDQDCTSPDTGKKLFYEDDNGHPVIVKCSCGGIISRVIGKNGPFWICNHCKEIYDDKNNKPVKKEKIQLYDAPSCPLCKTGSIVRKFSQKANKYYHICNNKDCTTAEGRKIFYEDDSGRPLITKCSCGGILSRIIGKKGPFWICNSCKKFYSDNNGKPKL